MTSPESHLLEWGGVRIMALLDHEACLAVLRESGAPMPSLCALLRPTWSANDRPAVRVWRQDLRPDHVGGSNEMELGATDSTGANVASRYIAPVDRDSRQDEAKNQNESTTMNANTLTAETISQTTARQIARLALDGDARYSHEAIGADDGDINDMEAEAGGRRIIRAANDSEVAVYERPDGSLVIVADANGPVSITAV